MAGVERIVCCHTCSNIISHIDGDIEYGYTYCGGPYSELWYTWGDSRLFQTWKQALEYWDAGQPDAELDAHPKLVSGGIVPALNQHTILVGEMGPEIVRRLLL